MSKQQQLIDVELLKAFNKAPKEFRAKMIEIYGAETFGVFTQRDYYWCLNEFLNELWPDRHKKSVGDERQSIYPCFPGGEYVYDITIIIRKKSAEESKEIIEGRLPAITNLCDILSDKS